jgi:hypothetical protein
MAIDSVDPWRIGEWLISYPDTFVRRGLFGEFLQILNLNGKQRIVAIAVTQILIYIPLLLFIFANLKKSGFKNESIALALGPASVSFLSWDHQAFGRKEGLGIAALVFIAFANEERNRSRVRMLIGGGSLLFLSSLFISEINLAFLPGIIYLILKNKKIASTVIKNLASFSVAVLSITFALLSILNRGSNKIASDLCNEIKSIGLDSSLCGGSIQALRLDIGDVIKSNLELFPLYITYIPLFGWALIPVMSSVWFKNNIKSVLAMTCFIAPLFILASDYGRWIFMFNIQIVICMFAMETTQNIFSRVRTYRLMLFLVSFSIPHSNLQLEEIIFGPFQSLIYYWDSAQDIFAK